MNLVEKVEDIKVKFFQKPSLPLFVIGIGILIFILALTSVYAVMGKTDTDLINNFFQRIYLNSDKQQIVFASPGSRINLVYVGPQTAGGLIDADPLSLTLFDPKEDRTFLFYEQTTTLSWKDKIPYSSSKLRESLIEISENLPDEVQPGTELQLKLEGKIDYPLLMHGEEAYSVIKNIDHTASLQIVNRTDMLKIVRKRPNLIMAIGFPVSLLLIVWGMKTELYDRRKIEKQVK